VWRAVFAINLVPTPSNQLFMAAGLAHLDLRIVAGAFFTGRVVSYTLFAHVAHRAVGSLTDLFAATFTQPQLLALGLTGVGILVALAKIPGGDSSVCTLRIAARTLRPASLRRPERPYPACPSSRRRPAG
jgi:hypothetical protein